MRNTILLCLVFVYQALPAQFHQTENVYELLPNTITIQKSEQVNCLQLNEIFVEDRKFWAFSENGVQTQNCKNFNGKSSVKAMGFSENTLNRELTIFGNIASVIEPFETRINSRAVQCQGINEYHLMKIVDACKIVEVLHQLASKDLPQPKKW